MARPSEPMGNLRVYKDSTVVAYLYNHVQRCFFLRIDMQG